MKNNLTNYSFNAAAKQITLTDVVTGSLDRLAYIKNLTTNQTIFSITDTAGFGGTFSSNVFTFTVSNAGMNNTDKLLIIYYLDTSLDTQNITLEGFQTDFYPDALPVDKTKKIKATFDVKGSLKTRSAILTDEGTIRCNFANSSLAVNIGTCTFTNGSNIVTGTNFALYDIKEGNYVKLSTDADSALVQVTDLEDNKLTLISPYTGTGGTGTGVRQILKSTIGTGMVLTVASGQATIAANTTANSVSVLGVNVDVAPLVFRKRLSISQRIINQTINIGFNEEGTPIRWYARFSLDGTVNTTVKCQTARNPTVAPTGGEIEETVITLPNGLNTSALLEYKVELLTENVNFYINDLLVATHTKVIPSQYDLMSAGIAIINGGTAPATNTNIVMDYLTVKNHNKIEMGLMSSNESIVAQQPVSRLFQFNQAGVIAINTDLITIDCSQLASLYIHCVSMGTTGVVTAQWSNTIDFANPITATLFDQAGASSTTFNAGSIIRVCNKYARYFRLRLTTATTAGTTTINVTTSQLTTQTFFATQAISGTVTANIGTGSIAAGTNAIGDVGQQYRANATGAGTPTNLNSPATPTNQPIKATTGRLIGIYVSNSNAATRFLKVFNVASPVLGTTSAILDIAIPPNNNPQFIAFEGGIAFSTAITVAITANRGVTDNTAITANDVTGFTIHA